MVNARAMTDELNKFSKKLDRIESLIGAIVSPLSSDSKRIVGEHSSNDNNNPHASPQCDRPGSCQCERPAATQKPSDAELLDLLLILQGLRSKFIDHELLYDPVWNMAIDLMLAKLRGERVSVSSACLASGVPETTALRYLAIMQERNLVERYPDPHDKRRTFVQISKQGEEVVTACLDRVRCLIAAFNHNFDRMLPVTNG